MIDIILYVSTLSFCIYIIYLLHKIITKTLENEIIINEIKSKLVASINTEIILIERQLSLIDICNNISQILILQEKLRH